MQYNGAVKRPDIITRAGTITHLNFYSSRCQRRFSSRTILKNKKKTWVLIRRMPVARVYERCLLVWHSPHNLFENHGTSHGKALTKGKSPTSCQSRLQYFSFVSAQMPKVTPRLLLLAARRGLFTERFGTQSGLGKPDGETESWFGTLSGRFSAGILSSLLARWPVQLLAVPHP